MKLRILTSSLAAAGLARQHIGLTGSARKAGVLLAALGVMMAGAADCALSASAASTTPVSTQISMPAHLDLSHRSPVTASGLPAPMSGCGWYTVAESTRSNLNLNMDISVLGQFNTSGYCGRASDHVCATPTNSSYLGGLLIWNWWYPDGNYQRTVQNFFTPHSGQTVCSYSGGFNASRYAEADGEFIQENAPGYQNIAGEYGVHGDL